MQINTTQTRTFLVTALYTLCMPFIDDCDFCDAIGTGDTTHAMQINATQTRTFLMTTTISPHLNRALRALNRAL
jgi:hypothetical protein